MASPCLLLLEISGLGQAEKVGSSEPALSAPPILNMDFGGCRRNVWGRTKNSSVMLSCASVFGVAGGRQLGFRGFLGEFVAVPLDFLPAP